MSLCMIETNIFSYFSIANRTELQWIFVVFLNAIEAIHQATVIHTVSYPKHMSNLMNHRSY